MRTHRHLLLQLRPDLRLLQGAAGLRQHRRDRFQCLPVPTKWSYPIEASGPTRRQRIPSRSNRQRSRLRREDIDG